VRARLEGLLAALRGQPVVQRVLVVIESANAVAAPLLAMSLAYNTMFAILPGILLLAGVMGWLIEDTTRQAELLAGLVSLVPPLAPVFVDSLESLVDGREALSIIGLVGLLWGASSFYAALDDVMRRLFPGGSVRGFVSVRLRGALAVLVLILIVVGTIGLGGLWALIETTFGEHAQTLSIGLPLLSIALLTLVVLGVYRWVPTAPPTIREALLPAIAAGIGIGLLTNLFAALAPLLVGGLSAFGVLTAVFAAFIWLNLSFQLLLWGAAWARYRRDTQRLAGRSVTPATSEETSPG
jgi:membrane protein